VVSPDDIEAAARRIAGHVRCTPVVESSPRLWLKLELLQHTGTFKPRGMFNRVLSGCTSPAGLIVASGGNAGLATAYVGQRLGQHVEVFVPVGTPTVKVQRLEDYGATVVKIGDAYADALAASEERRAETGALLVHAYDQPEVVAGQGTVGRELSEQVAAADTVVVSVGGGGLIAGIAAWYAGSTRIVAVESRGCPTLHEARAAGRPVDVTATGVAKDSLGAARIGDIAWEHLQAGHVSDSVLVVDADIMNARRWLWQELRVVTEPGTAAAVAALRTGAYRPAADETVVVVLCGANTEPADLATES
jgi:threonine dehydratase